MLIIGEKINASIKSVAEAIANQDTTFLQELARKQAAAGANYIDINVGGGHGSEQASRTMQWLVEVIQTATDRPLAIDSDDPNVIAAGLERYWGRDLIINSVTAAPERLETIGRMAAERGAGLVALSMGQSGVPDNVAARLEACETIMTYVTGLGMKPEQLYFDPLVIPVAVENGQDMVTLKTLTEIKARYPGAKTVMGLSNVSYGLPGRKLVNRAFLLMAVASGLDGAILDPLDEKIMGMVRVADMLAGRDNLCRGYLRAQRQGKIKD